MTENVAIWGTVIFSFQFSGFVRVDRNRTEICERSAVPISGLFGTTKERTLLELCRPGAAVQERQGNFFIPNKVPSYSWGISGKRSGLLFAFFLSTIQSEYFDFQNFPFEYWSLFKLLSQNWVEHICYIITFKMKIGDKN